MFDRLRSGRSNQFDKVEPNDDKLKKDLKKLSSMVFKIDAQINERIKRNSFKEKHIDRALKDISYIITVSDEDDQPLKINKKTLKTMDIQQKMEIWNLMLMELKEAIK